MKFWMLPIVVCSVVFSSVVAADSGDPIDLVIDGRNYRCMARPEGGGLDQVNCVNRAYSGPFTREESQRLCESGRGEGPALCAIKAYSGPFTREESLSLCRGVWSVGPADCVLKAYSGPFTREESLNLCASPWADVRTAECALKAYAGPYSREDALRICRESRSFAQNFAGEAVPQKLLSKTESELVLIRANEKALAEGTYKK